MQSHKNLYYKCYDKDQSVEKREMLGKAEEEAGLAAQAQSYCA